VIYFREAFGALLGYRLRTLLSLTGLVVGVGAVIAIQILGTAMTGATVGIFQGFSNYTFLLYPNFQNGFSQNAEITFAELAKLQSIPNVALAIPYWQMTQFARFGHNTAQLVVSSVGPQAEFFSQPLAAGRLISPGEIDENARVCIVSDSGAQKLAPGEPLLGATIRVGSLECQVIGVLQKPPSGAQNFDFGSDVYLPYTTFNREYLPFRRVYQVLVLVDDVGRISETEDTVKAALSELKNGKFTYQTFDNFFLAQIVGRLFGTLTLIVGVIAAISLVVSGIGIMNILLVSITERTREIGIRKAIGAHRSQIMMQFFLEAALLTFTGCALGTLLGIGIGWWINSQYIIKISGVIVAVPWLHSVVLATIFAAIVTFAFGTYPAYRAASLKPIEALRYE
jgi:ABC-type antimicrobial peptide transport system permease subunit